MDVDLDLDLDLELEGVEERVGEDEEEDDWGDVASSIAVT